mmetsp:Transcript_32893/g.99132  ORF Transcript_32893/g.99132 Transcript_32893/m.99132 type:complete len:382 (+) Transcript_32893:13180-14325(+)
MGYTHPMDDGQERTFKVKFEGEGVDDYGGPYREIFAQISNELQKTSQAPNNLLRCVLPLLLPANEPFKFVINPGLTSQSSNSTFEFLGKLMGVALRCKVALPLALPSSTWKIIVSQELVINDLLHMDNGAFAMISQLEQMLLCADNNACQSLMDMSGIKWTARLSGNSNLDLIETTGNTLAIGEIPAFVSALYKCRLRESETATWAIRKGLTSIIPKFAIPIFSWNEIETKVGGVPGVDINILQSNTEYDDGISPCDRHIQTFWYECIKLKLALMIHREILHSFDDTEKSAFLRFVWARARLPNSSNLSQKFKIQAAVGLGSGKSPDCFLPKAHTCFFSINLPKYSSKEIMLARLKYAMWNCTEMDADFKLSDSELTGWPE